MKIGIFFNARRDQGGLYQYALTLVDCCYKFLPEDTFFLFNANLEPFPINIERKNWRKIDLASKSIKPRMLMEYSLMQAARLGLKQPVRIIPRYRQIEDAEIDLMIYVKPTIYSFLWDYTFIAPIHDLQHVLQPEFPEVSQKGEFARREFLYKNMIPKALAILTDSSTGIEDVVQIYGCPKEKLFALPYVAPSYLNQDIPEKQLRDGRMKYNLPEKYLFYPASFWSHKNHARLLRAVRLIRDRYALDVHLVLAGSFRHEYEQIRLLTEELEIASQVHFLGYVPDADMSFLYRGATALTMPTFFGPTNIPYLEAWALGCPVITSDIRGIREHVGNAGVLIDPRSEEQLAEAIYKIYTDHSISVPLVKAGYEKIQNWQPIHFGEKLAQIIDVVTSD